MIGYILGMARVVQGALQKDLNRLGPLLRDDSDTVLRRDRAATPEDPVARHGARRARRCGGNRGHGNRTLPRLVAGEREARLSAWMLLVLFFTDWDHHLLPDAITLTGFVGGMAIAAFNPFLAGDGTWGRVWTALYGAALGSGIFWGIGAAWKRLRGVDAMGLGDVKMMAMVGAFTGPAVLFTLFFASIVGAVVGVARIPFRGGSLRDELPFGCSLAPAALAARPLARRAIDAYLGLVGLGA